MPTPITEVSSIDLTERLLDVVRASTPSKYEVNIGYLPPVGGMTLQVDPGGHEVDSYLSGDKDMAINYEVAILVKSLKEALDTIKPVSDVISNLRSLTSADGSFEFDHCDLTGSPWNSEKDERNNIYCMFTFTAYVLQYAK